MESIEEQWTKIINMSMSKDRFERTAALTISISFLEVALTAIGIKKDRKGFRQRFSILLITNKPWPHVHLSRLLPWIEKKERIWLTFRENRFIIYNAVSRLSMRKSHLTVVL